MSPTKDQIIAEYIASNRDSITLSEHDRSFDTILPYVKGFNILDWGCGIGFDMARFISSIPCKVVGCDITDTGVGEYASFELLDHPWKLPFSDEQFDTILGAGTIEHVSDEGMSMRELWRILKPNGRLIFTYAPQRYSILEWINRRLGRPNHPKRYTKRELSGMFLRHGFEVIATGIHHSTPMSGPRWIRRLWMLCAPTIERSLGPLTQNLWIVGEKSYAIGTMHVEGVLTAFGKDWKH